MSTPSSVHSHNCCVLPFQHYTDKKDKRNFLTYKTTQMGSVAKSYIRKGFLIYEEMRKYFTIYEEAVIHTWLCTPSLLNFLIYKENLCHKLNMDLDLQSLFGLHVHGCTHWRRPRKPPPPPPYLGSYTRALLVNQDRRHLLVTPGCRLYRGRY